MIPIYDRFIIYEGDFDQKYGDKKMFKIISLIENSKSVKLLIEESIKKRKVPNYKDFIDSVYGIPYFWFSKVDTLTYGTILAFKKWHFTLTSYPEFEDENKLNEIFDKIVNECSRMKIKINPDLENKTVIVGNNYVDNTIYKTIKIGNQEWMIENLNLNKFRNGDIIPEAKTIKEWEKAGKKHLPAWCCYENINSNCDKYGKLYNWYAVNDKRILAPRGYHIPSKEEWLVLLKHFDSDSSNKLKSNYGWKKDEYHNGNGTNESGFNGLPGGSRVLNGYFVKILIEGDWWSNTITDPSQSEVFTFGLTFHERQYPFWEHVFSDGVSVRCIKD